MQTGKAPKPWTLWKATNDPNRISFDPLLYSVVLQVSAKTTLLGSWVNRSNNDPLALGPSSLPLPPIMFGA